MKSKGIRLFGWAWPLVLLPLMSFDITQTPDWLAGTEGRTLISQLLSQILAGIAGALIQLFTYGFFGVQFPAA
jgi:hypothetical protein